jgi:hypothetical protein
MSPQIKLALISIALIVTAILGILLVARRRPRPRASALAAIRAATAARRAAEARIPAPLGRAYSAAELELRQAMQEYMQKGGRMYPAWSEVLEVLEGVGYVQPADRDSES